MDKKPFVALEQLGEIEKTYPIPFYTYDERGIRENTARLKQASSWNEGYKGCLAVKTMPDPSLLNILKDMECSTDCSSMTELMMFRACSFSGPGIMFSSNGAPPEKFAYAKRLGVIINLDGITHIQCLEETLGHIPKTISCRFNPGGLFRTSNDIMDNPGDSKYGTTTGQIGQAFKTLKEKGAKRFDIHAFLVNNTVTNEYYPVLAKTPFEPAARLKEETGVYIMFINLSGGIGMPYRPDQESNDILIIGDDVRRVHEEILVPAGMEDVVLCIELERSMMRPYGALVTKTIHEKHTCKEYVDVDACAANPMRSAMYGACHHITVIGREDEPCIRVYDVVGSLCGNNDKFAIDCMPPEIRRGDPLFIHDAGAHGLAMGHNYNGRLRSAEPPLKEDGTVEMIRRVETPEDYFATFSLYDILRDIE